MMVRGECFQLPPWVQDTGATAFGELSGDGIKYLTPCVNGLEGGSNGMTKEERRKEYPIRVTMKTRKRLCAKSPTWPTPTVFGNGNRREYGGKSGDGLDTAVKRVAESTRLPTPQVADAKQSIGKNRDGRQIMLIHAIHDRAAQSATWPTPTAHDRMPGTTKTRGFIIDGKEMQRNLNDIVVRRTVSSLWPTPCASDHRGPGKNGADRDRLDYAVERCKTKSHTYPTVGTKTMGGCSDSFTKLKKLEEAGRLTPEERRAMSSHITDGKDMDTANCRLLNPDWVEWLMGWPIRWTDVDFRNAEGGQCVMPWLDIADDPADWPTPLMGRITRRKTNRSKRIETLGNGQVPLCAAVAFVWGFEILHEIVKGNEICLRL